MHDAGDTGRTRARTTTPRRALFRGTTALLAATVLPAACQGEAFAAEPDDPVIALHRALLRQNEVVKAIEAEGDKLMPRHVCPETVANEAEFSAAIDVRPARTPVGRRAKADALRMAFENTVCGFIGHTIVDIDDDGEWQERLAWSLARDVLAEGAA